MSPLTWLAIAFAYLFGSLFLAIAIGKWLHRHTIIGKRDRAGNIPYLPAEAALRRHPNNVRKLESKVSVPRRLG